MKKLFTISLLLISFLSVKAADILVNSSGLPGSYTTLSAAVQAASAGDRILISPQIMIYQEDTLVIDKDLTLMSYTNTFVSFDGKMQLTLDAISNFTLIGFRGNDFSDLISIINDTAINSLSVINIIDCKIGNISMDQPKTSLYLSYSIANQVAFSHGDIIGNRIDRLYFGSFNYNSPVVSSIISTNQSAFNNGVQQETNYFAFWPAYDWETYNGGNVYTRDNFLNNNKFITECELFQNYLPFGNEQVYSDTCNIIANWLTGGYNALTMFNLDFPFNVSNNYFDGGYTFIYLVCPASKGTNQWLNNDNTRVEFNLAYCLQTSTFNYSYVKLEFLNNKMSDQLDLWSTNVVSQNTDYSSLPINQNSVFAYNSGGQVSGYGNGISNFADLMWSVGPYNNSNDNPNPSLKYLNLDLTPNQTGIQGGSNAWINYHGVGDDENVAGKMPAGGRARITYLNLPTQIFNPANIRVKAKAVHGN